MEKFNPLEIKSLNLNTYMDSCEGMCKRVFTDIEKIYPDEVDLVEAYFNDKNHGGLDYSYIIKLGQLIKELEEIYLKHHR